MFGAQKGIFGDDPQTPRPPVDVAGRVDTEAALAADAERKRKAQTKVARAGSVAEALASPTAKTVLGGTS